MEIDYKKPPLERLKEDKIKIKIFSFMPLHDANSMLNRGIREIPTLGQL